MFKRAVVRVPGRTMVNGLTQAALGRPDYNLALEQHDKYVQALIKCGLDVTILQADEGYPDSTFIEDTALLTKECAVITNPGADSRKGEIAAVKEAVSKFYSKIETIKNPGTLDAGDIMMAGSHFYIGLSKRTNLHGAEQMISILEKYSFTASTVTLKDVLHLKSGVSYLENSNLIAAGEFVSKPEFKRYNILKVKDSESYAANCVWVNGSVLMAAGYPAAKRQVENAGYPVIELDMSEFRKLDGGLSCLSLRF